MNPGCTSPVSAKFCHSEPQNSYQQEIHHAAETGTEAAIDHGALATQLQLEGAASFSRSWQYLMASIESKSRKQEQNPADMIRSSP